MVAYFKEIEVDDTVFDDIQHMDTMKKAQLIEDHLTQREIDHIPGDLSAAVEYGYAAIII